MTEAEAKNLENQKELMELENAYKRFSCTDDGKVILADLKRFCGYDTTSVCEQRPNSLQTFFAEGKRRVFLRINSFIERKHE